MKLISLIAMLACLTSCHYINQQLGLEDDNDGEEIIEEIIDQELGPDVDLTPKTPENK